MLGRLLVLSTALVPAGALAQTDTAAAPAAEEGGTAPAEVPPGQYEEEEVEISAPGADPAQGEDIVVTGRNIPNVIRSTPEVISVLSSADIARSGEGDIAGALQRVTGLSVVGGRFVYVRGLGERYSLALLNGNPLPSPEPLRRVVPLDIFPTSVIASSVVQKSYSVNYPGEFGGGVINLTTRSAPEEPFLTIGGSVGGDTETTFNLGYTYYGSDTDWTGFDDGTRSIPRPLANALSSNRLIVVGPNFSEAEVKDITASLVNAPTTLIQRNNDIPVNGSISVSGGYTYDVPGGGQQLSVLFAGSWSNSWQTRGGLQQLAAGITPVNGEDTLQPDVDYRFLSTENRILVNGLVAFGFKFGEHQLRWTNLYIRDTLKEARIQSGTNQINVGSDLLNISNTAWFERQLIDTQFVGEFEFGALDVDLRGTYAQSRRLSPYERTISYRVDAAASDYVNDLRTNGQFARVAFSDLTDNVYSGGLDLSYRLAVMDASLSAGAAWLKNDRRATRRDFRYTALDILPLEVAQERPDYLLSDHNIYAWDIVLTDISGTAGAARYVADLEVKAVYLQAEAEILPQLRLQTGVRFEKGEQRVTPIDLFGTGGADITASLIEEDYLLPAATVTWNFADNLQLRVHGSKTIARPQFRELAPQQYSDPETDRTFFGNQYLTDSELLNAEARLEWYFARDQRLSVAGFWKKIDRPIEAVAFQQGGTFFTTFANAPEATLKGAEIELQKYVPLEGWGGSFFTPRRLVLIGNYTWSQSAIRVGDGDTTIPVGTAGMPVPAGNVFDDGTPLTGQSKHLANLQLGLESTDRLSQQTLLLTWASKRVTNRGANSQPDVYEEPGLRLDFVAREGVSLFGRGAELKFEVRNLLGEDYEEYQALNGTRVDTNSYAVGRSFSVGLEVAF
jgi:TonB-dependent receptor